MSLRTMGLVCVVLACLASCDRGSTAGPNDRLSGSCGLPTPDPIRADELVPERFLPEGAEIAKAEAERGGFVTAINVPLPVQQALDFYKSAVKEGGYEIIQSDNEVFEAEIYLRKGERVAAIQIRRSTCDDRSIVFINEIIPEEG